MDRILFCLSFIPKMTAENTNYTLGQEPLAWLTYILEDYSNYLAYPLIMPAILIILYYPFAVLFFTIYCGSAFYAISKKIYKLPEDITNEKWDKIKKRFAFLSDITGKIFHGYEVCGIENLPKGPALLVYYHGSIPIDYYFFVLRIYRVTGRFPYSVIDNSLSLLPGLKLYLQLGRCGNPTREECVEILKKGNLLGLAPGGLREQNYGDKNYKLLWGKRKGFAQVAIDAKVPIIPLFTQNMREGYRTYGNIAPMRWLYERTRSIAFPTYGLFPVKLRTHIGQPIPYDPNLSAEEVAEKAKIAVEALRDKHQKIPGSILRALWERFETHHKDE
ncbi:DGAT1/2-independent enzyme synthesizing storage lipids-like [Elgaria multicarinata webbii]|uniref:DGAT1/2-independent enzyme synthesizing storage lipids-like n=1 Tax=Elgaria multicarinata webbii TaxID=159646 RepID=UPI002FCD46A7